MVYKNTILPLLEYVDFVYDYGVGYVNKRLQTLQNQGLYIVYNQHYLPYDQKDSSDVLHRRANIYRLIHRRNMHMLSFIFNYRQDLCRLDVRDIPTRRHDGILFKKNLTNHYKLSQDPYIRATNNWNTLPVYIRSVEDKEMFKKLYITTIADPYKKILL